MYFVNRNTYLELHGDIYLTISGHLIITILDFKFVCIHLSLDKKKKQ